MQLIWVSREGNLFLQMGLDRPFRKTRSDLPVRQNQYDPAHCRPGERRDPYAAASLFGKVATGFCSNKRRWLWVPAFAGTTLEIVIARSHRGSPSASPMTGASGLSNAAALR